MSVYYLMMILMVGDTSRVTVQNFNNRNSCISAGNSFLQSVNNINAASTAGTPPAIGSYTCNPATLPHYNMEGNYVT